MGPIQMVLVFLVDPVVYRADALVRLYVFDSSVGVYTFLYYQCCVYVTNVVVYCLCCSFGARGNRIDVVEPRFRTVNSLQTHVQGSYRTIRELHDLEPAVLLTILVFYVIVAIIL